MKGRVLSEEEAWALVGRRLQASRGDLPVFAAEPRSWWQDQGRKGPVATALLSGLVARALGDRLRILGDQDAPHLLVAEAARLRSRPPGVRAELLARHERLRHLVPYPVDPAVRLETLALLPDAWFAVPGERERLLHLAAGLAERPSLVAAAAEVPVELLRPGDGAHVALAEIARRIGAEDPRDLGPVPVELLPPPVRPWADVLGAPFVRLFCRATTFAATLLCCFAEHHRRRPSLASLVPTVRRADELAIDLGLDGRDPLSADATALASLVATARAVADFDDRIEWRLATAPISTRSAAVRATKGIVGLRALLLVAEAHGAQVEALPARWACPAGARFFGVEDDDEILDPATAAAVAAFGFELLGGSDGGPGAQGWAIAWSTGCRPKESLPCREDFVEVDGGYLVYVDRETGKTGARVLLCPQAAVDAFGIDPMAFPARRGRQNLRAAELDWRVRLLEASCRQVRAAWREQVGQDLPGRTAYFIRHAVADQLRRRAGERPWLLPGLLGHAEYSVDAPYTKLGRAEHADVVERLCVAERKLR